MVRELPRRSSSFSPIKACCQMFSAGWKTVGLDTGGYPTRISFGLAQVFMICASKRSCRAETKAE